MAITTRIAPFYGGQKLLAFVLCAVFGVWGAYDYFVKIPRQEKGFQVYLAVKEQFKQLDDLRAAGKLVDPEQIQQYEQTKTVIEAMAPGGNEPTPPSKFNRVTQWFYMACLPFAPYFLWLFIKAKRQRYTLDDHGALHFTGDPQLQTGVWRQDEMADIDMSRWMAKSIAYLVHNDGTRLTLDAYLHKDLHLIIGAIASQFYPDQWDAQAKQIKSASDADAKVETQASGSGTDEQTPAGTAA
jgi:hypothetical protein